MATANAQPYGVLLPITLGPQGYFNQSYNIVDQIKTNMTMLLKTKKGERRMNTNFGSGLWNILFEQNNENIVQIIESTIRKDVATYMSYVNIESIDIDRNSDSSQHRINVSVSYTVPSVGLTNEQVLIVEMNTNNI